MNRTEFIKSGDKIMIKPNGLDYALENEKAYCLKYDRYDGIIYLEEMKNLSLPKKLYNTSEDSTFINRVVTYFNNTDKLTTGVMLNGIKGTGKTVMAKQIAIKSKLPIIIIDSSLPIRVLNSFFEKISTQTAIIFDEIDKNWDSSELLTWLDGVTNTSKKLVLFTCNDYSKINDYLKDRCSRIRYVRTFNALDNERFLKDIIIDKGFKKGEINELYDFIINNFALLSIDNINAFLDEKLMFYDLSNKEILNDLNINSKKNKPAENNIIFNNVENNKDCDEDYNEEDYDEESYDEESEDCEV